MLTELNIKTSPSGEAALRSNDGEGLFYLSEGERFMNPEFPMRNTTLCYLEQDASG